ncbi:MAG: helix-turn-helix transcriptional regulator [Flavobacteriales bacterium]|nr:helix-turn-helix transcriptional regulator [Flavobacteriales bacterium]
MPVSKSRDEKLLIKFGSNLRSIRLRKGLSQEELSYKSDLDISQIGRIERGKVNTSLSILHKIAIALDISLKELVDFEEL